MMTRLSATVSLLLFAVCVCTASALDLPPTMPFATLVADDPLSTRFVIATASGSIVPGNPDWVPQYVYQFAIGTVLPGGDLADIHLVENTTGVLPKSEFKRGDEVTLICWAKNGDSCSAANQCPMRVFIVNRAPDVAHAIVITPRQPTTADDVVADCEELTDPDGDPVTQAYRWEYKQGPLWIPVWYTRQLPASLTTRGQVWRVWIASLDGRPFTDLNENVSPEFRIINAPPGRPAAPTIAPLPARTDDDLTAATAGATDADGDAVEYTYEWQRQSGDTWAIVHVGNPLPASLTAKAQTFRVHVKAHDGREFGGWSDFSSPVTIANTPPTVPTATSIAPRYPQEPDSVVATSSGSTDADGDTITYRYSWMKKTALGWVTATNSTNTLPPESHALGEVWKYTVRAFDGVLQSNSLAGRQFTVGALNHPPTAPTAVTIARINQNLVATAEGSTDSDGDFVIYSYSWWRKAGSFWQLGPSGATLDKSNLTVGQIWVAKACASDKSTASDWTTSAWYTVGTNTAPSTPTTPVISPATPLTADTLAATTSASDAEADPITYTWRWFYGTNGVNWTQHKCNQAQLPASETTRGQVWRVQVQASDGALQSSWSAFSSVIAIGNTPPGSPAKPTLSPLPARRDRTLTCSLGSASDADGDALTYSYQWCKGNPLAPTTTTSRTLPAGVARRGEAWAARVRARDAGGDYGAWTYSDPVTVVDSPPTPPAKPVITPDKPHNFDPLNASCGGSTDPDGDTVTYGVTWLKLTSTGFAETGDHTASLPASATSLGDTWMVAVWSQANGAVSDWVFSDPVVIGNAPPSAPAKPVISPANPRTDNDLTTTLTGAVDPEGDAITYACSWQREEAAGQWTQVSFLHALPASFTSRGEHWRVAVWASDGGQGGPSERVYSDEVEIADSPPTPPGKPVVSPEQPRTDNPLSIAAPAGSTDADGDAVEYQVLWEKVVDSPSRQRAYQELTLPAAATTKGDSWVAKVRARTPGTTACSAWVSSDPVMILDTPPTAPSQPVIVPATPASDQDLSVNPEGSTDADGDAIAYQVRWYRGLTPMADGAALPASLTLRGQIWSARVRAVADSMTSRWVSSADVEILNAAPTLLGVPVISPARPTTDADLVPTAASGSDADGDALTVHYRWVREAPGDPVVRDIDGTLPAAETTKGEVWHVEQRLDDGHGGLCDWVAGASVTIANSRPTPPTSVTIAPSPPADSSRLAANSEGETDADGDALTYGYEWSSSPTGDAPWTVGPRSRTVPPEDTSVGQWWKVRVRVKDTEGLWSTWRFSARVRIVAGAPAGTALTAAVASPRPAGGAQLAVTLSAPATVQVVICNLAGRPVAALPERPCEAGTTLLLWDGRAAGGVHVPAGQYLAQVRARSATGACTQLCSSVLIR